MFTLFHVRTGFAETENAKDYISSTHFTDLKNFIQKRRKKKIVSGQSTKRRVGEDKGLSTKEKRFFLTALMED